MGSVPAPGKEIFVSSLYHEPLKTDVILVCVSVYLSPVLRRIIFQAQVLPVREVYHIENKTKSNHVLIGKVITCYVVTTKVQLE